MTRNLDLVIFDWNGTLIDDVWLSVNALNGIMEKRRLKPLTTEFYREHFCFPAVNFYREISLDVNNDWDDIVKEFTENYENGIDKVKLFPDVVPVLEELKRSGLKLGILSVMEHNTHTAAAEIKGYLILAHISFFQIGKLFLFGAVDYRHIHEIFKSCLKVAVQKSMTKYTLILPSENIHIFFK
ncbi:HAD hydrolase-like protein, partial [bacterium]|nr:HAD hydrolase-like protein [bacterium]